MKKIIKLLIFVLVITLNVSFAQERYHYEIDEGGNLTDDTSQEDEYGRPVQTYGYGNNDYVYTYPLSFEVNANRSDLEAVFGHTWEEDTDSFLTSAGFSALYSEDNYKIGSASFALGNRGLIERMKFEMGFRGVLGTVEKDRKSGDVGAVGFLISVAYDFPEIDFLGYGIPIDLEFSGNMTAAPSQLCTGDLDEYLEMKTTMGLYLLGEKKGMIFIGYRNVEARFEEDDDKWKKSEGDLFMGYRFVF
ncbi:hypothetical protein QUF80_04095 [Desulfococcaceae bacterium HSG8]|nr:hypothetical protein [Desulfococcaceae bacterium HSG8]